MKKRIHIIIICAVLAMMAGCTHRSETKNDEKAKAAWQRYYEAYDAKNLKRALTVIDSMETEDCQYAKGRSSAWSRLRPRVADEDSGAIL